MNKPGIILITTLLIVMILSIISVQISKNFYISLKREAYLDFKNLSHQMLMSSEKQAIKSLQKNIKSFQSKLTLNDSLLNNKFYFQNDLMILEVSILDASNCFNLNSLFKPSGNSYEIRPLYKAWLKRYLKLKQFNEADIESFIDQLVDWVDRDNQPLNFGAENYFYIGPASKISQFTPKRLLVDISEINNFPIMERVDYRDLITNLCVFPNRNNQIININSLVQSDSLLIAAFFDEENLEYIASQILNMPKNGYDDVNVFIDQFNQASKFPSQVLSINSQTFRLQSDIINENFSANLETLVILDNSNSAEVLGRTFNF
ncbi:MAG: type II secretion system minor pseudopilin GspK [SAR86 cluster bacterium]|nr:type II secretion system minor pseudopilin GspK [SAR86 cluster bacterium]